MKTVEDLMIEAAMVIDEDPERARQFGGVYKFVLDGDGARTFILIVSNASGPSFTNSPCLSAMSRVCGSALVTKRSHCSLQLSSSSTSVFAQSGTNTFPIP